MNSNYENIINILEELNINYKEINHDVSHSCDESKKYRKDAWLEWIWSKNIIFHCKWNYYIVTTHWDKQIKARNFKHEFWSKDIRFANQDEITSIIDSTIWSIPPFWFYNKEICIFLDKEIFEYDFFIFNPSIPTKSIQIYKEDLIKIYNNLPNPIKYFSHTEEEFELFESI